MQDQFKIREIPEDSMNVFSKLIRDLKISKYSIAKQLNITTASVYNYINKKQPLPISVARKVQALAKSKGIEITLDELYKDYPLEFFADRKEQKKEE